MLNVCLHVQIQAVNGMPSLQHLHVPNQSSMRMQSDCLCSLNQYSHAVESTLWATASCAIPAWSGVFDVSL